jgi:predicted phosphodiesterase
MKKLILLLIILLPGLSCKSSSKITAQENGSGGKVRQPFFFIEMADPQLGFASGSKDFELEIRNMEQAIAVVNRLKPDFVVIAGDFVNNYNNPSQLNEFDRLLGLFDSSVPVYLIPGNHDIKKIESGSEIEPYISRYGYDRFSFKHKGCRFIGINSNVIKDNFEPLIREQDIWLESELSGTSMGTPTFVFMHCPMFSHSFDEKETYSNFSMADRSKYIALFLKYGVDGVFSGHLHNSSNVEVEGITFITTGSITKPLGNGGFSGMSLVKVWPDHFTSEFIALDGTNKKHYFKEPLDASVSERYTGR